MPRYLHLAGTLRDGRKRKLVVRDFDKAQTLAAFRTLHAAYPLHCAWKLIRTLPRVGCR